MGIILIFTCAYGDGGSVCDYWTKSSVEQCVNVQCALYQPVWRINVSNDYTETILFGTFDTFFSIPSTTRKLYGNSRMFPHK